MPFSYKGKEKSISQYKSIGYRYLSFYQKVYYIRQKEVFKYQAIRFTDKQWSLLDDLIEELKADWVLSSYNSRFHSGREIEGKKKDQDKDKDRDGDEYQDNDSNDNKGERGGKGITSPR